MVADETQQDGVAEQGAVIWHLCEPHIENGRHLKHQRHEDDDEQHGGVFALFLRQGKYLLAILVAFRFHDLRIHRVEDRGGQERDGSKHLVGDTIGCVDRCTETDVENDGHALVARRHSSHAVGGPACEAQQLTDVYPANIPFANQERTLRKLPVGIESECQQVEELDAREDEDVEQQLVGLDVKQ